MIRKIIKACYKLKWLRYSDACDINDYACSYSQHLSRDSIYQNLVLVYACETRAIMNGIILKNYNHNYFINLYLYEK